MFFEMKRLPESSLTYFIAKSGKVLVMDCLDQSITFHLSLDLALESTFEDKQFLESPYPDNDDAVFMSKTAPSLLTYLYSFSDQCVTED